jgi:hypothetical protein
MAINQRNEMASANGVKSKKVAKMNHQPGEDGVWQ